jgi:small subunit ribosomal protein S20
MANTSSAKKAARKALRRTEINKSRRSRMKTEVAKVEEAIAAGNRAQALAALKTAEPVLMRTSQKGLVRRRMASRKVSRLVARIKALPETPA